MPKKEKTVKELNIKAGDYCIYNDTFYEVVWAVGYWVYLQPLPKVLVQADQVEITRRKELKCGKRRRKV